ncbi:Uncharacterized protein APZ42_018688 [Daphnia magna]|uniref:Uncharacterized protein n=1 Tax=Daphnia magna TaxID=35525 RepID=A0A0P5ZJI8_9CRUS|nr:Uncharacterized protein APZ42_018688 [Daphnia magna]
MFLFVVLRVLLPDERESEGGNLKPGQITLFPFFPIFLSKIAELETNKHTNTMNFQKGEGNHNVQQTTATSLAT